MIYQSFRLRGPPFEGVAVHTPQHRGHTFVSKNCSASFGKNRKSVSKAQQHQNMSIIMCTYTVHPGMPLGILMPIVFLHAAYKSCSTRRHVGESMCAKFEAGRHRSPFLAIVLAHFGAR